jgi:hypothetical protein
LLKNYLNGMDMKAMLFLYIMLITSISIIDRNKKS